jgi:histidyl-tRNA synthetase
MGYIPWKRSYSDKKVGDEGYQWWDLTGRSLSLPFDGTALCAFILALIGVQ